MNILATSASSFVIECKSAKLSINAKGGDISLFTSFQENTTDDTAIHWPGEYEVKGVSMFVSPVLTSSSIAKIFVEGVRIVILQDRDLKGYAEEKLLGFFENTDVLLCIKEDTGLESPAYKKLIEKIDPRIIICAEGESETMLKSFSFPMQSVAKCTITQDKLPIDSTEYYTLSL